MGLAQIGEFSFIIAQLGLTLKDSGGDHQRVPLPDRRRRRRRSRRCSTPYLIQASDPLVNALERRRAASGLMSYLEGYGQWLRGTERWSARRPTGAATAAQVDVPGRAEHRAGQRPVHRRDLAQPNRRSVAFRTAPQHVGGPRAIVWLTATLIALPLLVATFRKVRAVAMVIAEASIPRAAGGTQTKTLRAVMANTILLAVSTGVVLWMLLLSSPVLPPWRVMVILAIVIVTVSIVSWNRLIRVYAPRRSRCARR